MATSTSRALASLLCVLSFTARADWSGWHSSAWTNYRSATETVTVYATAHSYVLTNYVGTNATITTNAFLSNIYAASNGTSIVSTFSFVLTQTNGALWTNSITTTNRHAATNLILAPREIVCFDLYRAMRERDAALCAASSAKESVRFYRYERDNLTYAKTWLAANIANFVSTNQPAQSFAALNVPALLMENGLPTNYLAQTPYRALWCGDTGGRMIETSSWTLARSGTNLFTNVLTTTCGTIITNIGTATVVTAVCTNATPYEGINSNGATWGFCGITNVFNALIWTKAQGVVENCGGRSNVIASASCESNFVFAASAAGFPIYEARNTTNVTYQLEEVVYNAYVDAPFVPQDCPTNFPPPSPWLILNTNRGWLADSCTLPTNYWAEAGQTNLLEANYHTYAITNILTNVCDGLVCNVICSHLAPITFDNCTNRYGTNVVADLEQWFNIGSTGTCAGAVGLTDPFGYGMAVGWTNLFSNTNTIGLASSICNTNFAGTNRIPWQGSTTSTAWAVYDAALIKKWRFQYR